MFDSKQLVVFTTLWAGYAGTYLLRKPLGVGKSAMAATLGLTSKQLGLLDTAMLVPYAFVQTFFGWVGDVLGPRRTLTLCLIASALSMATFGSWSSFPMLCFLLFLNGGSQSLCWGNGVKAVSSAFEPAQHSKVLGIFSTSSFAGGIAGTTLAVQLMAGSDWRGMWLAPSVVLALLGVAHFFIVPDLKKQSSSSQQQHQQHQHDIEAADGKSESSKAGSSASGKQQALTFSQMMRVPMLPEVTLAYLLVKLVRYAFYMWLPMYLSQQLKYDDTQAGMISLTFEIGGVVASAFMGYFIEHFFKGRDLVGSTAALAICSVSLVLFSMTSSWGLLPNCLFMILAGAGNCGVDPILSGTLPIKFAQQMKVPNYDPTSQIASFINGIASMGPIVEGVCIGIIADAFGWEAVFYTITAMSILIVVILYRAMNLLGA